MTDEINPIMSIDGEDIPYVVHDGEFFYPIHVIGALFGYNRDIAVNEILEQHEGDLAVLFTKIRTVRDGNPPYECCTYERCVSSKKLPEYMAYLNKNENIRRDRALMVIDTLAEPERYLESSWDVNRSVLDIFGEKIPYVVTNKGVYYPVPVIGALFGYNRLDSIERFNFNVRNFHRIKGEYFPVKMACGDCTTLELFLSRLDIRDYVSHLHLKGLYWKKLLKERQEHVKNIITALEEFDPRETAQEKST